jgi:hypothetical protein
MSWNKLAKIEQALGFYTWEGPVFSGDMSASTSILANGNFAQIGGVSKHGCMLHTAWSGKRTKR